VTQSCYHFNYFKYTAQLCCDTPIFVQPSPNLSPEPFHTSHPQNATPIKLLLPILVPSHHSNFCHFEFEFDYTRYFINVESHSPFVLL
jgi:hypothetical protein